MELAFIKLIALNSCKISQYHIRKSAVVLNIRMTVIWLQAVKCSVQPGVVKMLNNKLKVKNYGKMYRLFNY